MKASAHVDLVKSMPVRTPQEAKLALDEAFRARAKFDELHWAALQCAKDAIPALNALEKELRAKLAAVKCLYDALRGAGPAGAKPVVPNGGGQGHNKVDSEVKSDGTASTCSLGLSGGDTRGCGRGRGKPRNAGRSYYKPH